VFTRKNHQFKIQQVKLLPCEDRFDDLAEKIKELVNSATQNDFPDMQFPNDARVFVRKNLRASTTGSVLGENNLNVMSFQALIIQFLQAGIGNYR